MNQKRPLSDRDRAFARAFLSNWALGRSRAATEAAKAVGYKGSSIASNARRKLQDARIKDYIQSLTRPAEAEAEAKVIATSEMVQERLSTIVCAKVDLEQVKPTDIVAAGRELNLMRGDHAPKRTEVRGAVETAHYMISDAPLTPEEWAARYAEPRTEQPAT